MRFSPQFLVLVLGKKSKLEGELCHIPAENCVSNLTCVDKWKDVVGPKDVGVCEKIGKLVKL